MMPDVANADFSTLEMIAYGASPISTQVLEDSLRVFGCGFTQLYGLTETTGAVTGLFPDDHDPDGPTVPPPALGGQAARRRRAAHRRLGHGGGLRHRRGRRDLVRTVQNMKGYWNLPDETAKTILDDGWLRSGDAGYLDEDGYLYIHDRVKDMIVSGGENIYPAEIENVLMAHPAVADVAVIGVPSDRWGETPKALIVKRRRRGPDRARAHRVLPRAPRQVQVPHVRRVDRRAAAQPLRQDPEEGSPRAVLGRPQPTGELTRW